MFKHFLVCFIIFLNMRLVFLVIISSFLYFFQFFFIYFILYFYVFKYVLYFSVFFNIFKYFLGFAFFPGAIFMEFSDFFLGFLKIKN